MAIRKIDNLPTIFAELNEDINLPTTAIVSLDGVEVDRLPIESWYPSDYVDTSKPADLIFLATISGHPEKVLQSVIVHGIDENPPSVYPDEIDNFGNPKVDIQTADIPDIDDFQYFKAKYPRTTVEGFQLMQLRELLADKVILARDINHLRNAVIEIEKFLKDLSDRVDDLEKRVEKLERETVIGGKNLGSGEGVYKDVSSRIMNFKSLKGDGGITISSSGDEITITAPEESPPTAGCGTHVKGDSFELCDATFPMRITDGSLDISDSSSFSFKMKHLVADAKGKEYPSLLICLGEGQDGAKGAGRILKVSNGFLFEAKVNDNKYVGFEVTSDYVGDYSVTSSKVTENLRDISDVYDMSQI